MLKAQFGFRKYYQIFDAVRACNRGFKQLVIRTRQVGFYREGGNSSLANVELHAVRTQAQALSLLTDFFFKLPLLILHSLTPHPIIIHYTPFSPYAFPFL
jgi:hypothetical protein